MAAFCDDAMSPLLSILSLYLLVSTYSRKKIASPGMMLRARTLRDLLEAEKSIFRGELSFQTSECTAELTVATIVSVLYFKDFSVLTV